MILKNITPQNLVCPHPGAIHVYYHTIQRSSSLKLLGQSKHPKEVGTKLYINGPGHMTKQTCQPPENSKRDIA